MAPTDGSNQMKVSTRMHQPVVFVVANGPVGRVCPELDERMRVRGFGSGPVVRRQEQESQQRHAPEETDPG